jgi:hypothetical protein
MKKRIALACCLLLLLAACQEQASPGGTYAWIDVPTNNLALPKVQVVKIEGHASSPDGINRVEILIDGQPYTTLNSPPQQGRLASYSATWSPTGPGEYVIVAIAYGNNGAASQPDAALVRVGGGPLAQAQPVITATFTPEPTVTGTPPPTLTPTVPPTDTPTPTETLTPRPEPVIQFWADPPAIKAGACTDLRWQVANVQRVVFGGVEQPFTGGDQECLCQAASFPLTVTHLDGRVEQAVVTVSVTGVCASPVPPDTTPPPAPVPAVPADGLALTCRAGQVLSWLPVDDPSGIAAYEVQVQRSTNQKTWSNAPGSPLTGLSGKSAKIAVECGWYYRWRVRAVDGRGNTGPWSNFSRFSIPLS